MLLPEHTERDPAEDVGGEPLPSVLLLTCLLPVERGELEDALHRPGRQQAEEVAQVGPGLDAKAGHNARFHRADALLRLLRQSHLDNPRDGLMAELIAVDLLVIDDFALESMTREESRDVDQLFVERTGRAATVITSNRDTAEWLTTFDDALLAQSAIDRFQNAAYDLVIEGESYRPRQKPTVDRAGPPPERPAE